MAANELFYLFVCSVMFALDDYFLMPFKPNIPQTVIKTQTEFIEFSLKIEANLTSEAPERK